MPYTHSSQVRAFRVIITPDGQTFVVTGGADCMIRTWRFDPTARGFVQMATLEGHTRPVTSLLLSGIASDLSE